MMLHVSISNFIEQSMIFVSAMIYNFIPHRRAYQKIHILLLVCTWKMCISTQKERKRAMDTTTKKIVRNFEGYLCGTMIAVMAIVVFLQVIFRFILKASLPWSEEVSRYLQVYITYFGTAYGIRTGAHLGIEAFTLLLPKPVRRVLAVFVQVISVFVCSLILKFGVDIVRTQMISRQVSPAMHIPMWMIYIAIPIGMGLCIIRYIIEIIREIKTLGFDSKEVM